MTDQLRLGSGSSTGSHRAQVPRVDGVLRLRSPSGGSVQAHDLGALAQPGGGLVPAR